MRSKLLVAVIVVLAGVDAVLLSVGDGTLASVIWSTRMTGWVAAIGLVATLSISPVHAVSGRFDRSQIRRALGVGAAVAAGIHAVVTLTGPLIADLWLLVYEPHLRAGASALVVLSILALTSFVPIARALRVRRWKDLHFLAYFAIALTVLHIALSSHASVVALVSFSVVVVGLFAARIRVPKRSGPARRKDSTPSSSTAP